MKREKKLDETLVYHNIIITITTYIIQLIDDENEPTITTTTTKSYITHIIQPKQSKVNEG